MVMRRKGLWTRWGPDNRNLGFGKESGIGIEGQSQGAAWVRSWARGLDLPGTLLLRWLEDHRLDGAIWFGSSSISFPHSGSGPT